MSDSLNPPPARARMRLAGKPRDDLLNGLAVTAFIIAALWLARQIFVPIALAMLLSFVLAPAVLQLRAWHLPRAISVFLVVAIAFGFIVALGTLLARQMSDLADDLPRYQTTITQKAEAVREAAAASALVSRVTSLLRQLSDGQHATPPAPASGDGAPASQEPVPVEVHQPSPSPFEMLRTIATTVLEPLATTGIVAIFTLFILMQREDLRDRLIRLLSGGDLHRTTVALDDAAERLSRFFIVQVTVNAAFGVAIGIGLYAIGIPSPLLWGLISAILRFVPYIGAIVSGLGPVALAAAVDPGWSMVLMTIALFLILEPLTGQVLEPLLYGHSTGLSPIAVVVAATFWTWLWGPIGLLLSTPLTVCLVVLGQNVEKLDFLNVILSDVPALTPQESFYQRLLAGDPSEAAEQAQDYLKTHTLMSFYDEIAMPALRFAQMDLRRGLLDPDQQKEMHDVLRDVMDDLGEITEQPETDKPTPAILCLGARTPLDEAAAAMLVQILQKNGLPADLTPAKDQLVETLCLSSLDADHATPQLRYAVRRMRRRWPETKIMACFWLPQDTQVSITQLARDVGADMQASNLAAAVDTCRQAQSKKPTPHKRKRSLNRQS